MRSLSLVIVIVSCLFASTVLAAVPVCPSCGGAMIWDKQVPHVTPVPVQPRHPRIYPHTRDMGPGEFYYDGWGRPYSPIMPPRLRWSPWPEHRQYPHGQGGRGKGPGYRYWYGPRGWGFGIGPNIVPSIPSLNKLEVPPLSVPPGTGPE